MKLITDELPKKLRACAMALAVTMPIVAILMLVLRKFRDR
jgi:hypothetical protein